MTLGLLVRFVEIVCVRSDGFEHMNTDHDDSEAGQIDGCNIMCYAEWLNSFRRCGWRHRAYFLTGINLNDSASVSVRRDIMECFIFVLKPDWSLYIQDGFFTWFTAHKANSALLTSSCVLLSTAFQCIIGRSVCHTPSHDFGTQPWTARKRTAKIWTTCEYYYDVGYF